MTCKSNEKKCSDTCPVTGSYHHCRSSVDRRDKINVHLVANNNEGVERDVP